MAGRCVSLNRCGTGAAHDALVAKTAPKRAGSRAPKGAQLLSGIAFCGNCGARLYIAGRADRPGTRTDAPRGYAASPRRRSASLPRPWAITAMDALVGAWFLARYGAGEVMRKIYDPGTGHAAPDRGT